ncbi:MAG: S1 family peptidase [Myxococcales bacterium]|nr:S1 family peptidase [Myxococcales bacterium]
MFGGTAGLGLVALAMIGGAAPLGDRPPPPQAIYGGEAVAPGEWPAVVAVDVAGLLCTGTLVTPELVLTAAHCLRSAPPLSSVTVRFGEQWLVPAHKVTAAAYGAHPDYCDAKLDCGEDCWDYAYVVLDSAVDPAIYPPSRIVTTQAEWDALMHIGAQVTLVGFGLDENDIQGIKRSVETTLTSFTATGVEFSAGGMGIDSCQGDSGGPAFVRDADGEALLAGVLSRGYACGDGGCYGIPAAILCWVSDESGVDIRPAGCSSCDCLDSAPDRGGCDGCAIERPRSLDAGVLLAPFIVAFARRRRRGAWR